MTTAALNKSFLQHNKNTAQLHDKIPHAAQGLKMLLADTYTLYIKTHYYHWNVKGPNFSSLHKLFEEQYKELAAAADEIAERIRTLGFEAPGTYKEFSELAHVTEDDSCPQRSRQMLENLVTAHKVVLETCHNILQSTNVSETDKGTEDLLVSRLKFHEKTLWMLESTLEE